MASKIGRWVKIFLKKSIGEDHLLVVLLGGGQFPQGWRGRGGGQKILGENEKLHNYGIKTNYFNLL